MMPAQFRVEILMNCRTFFYTLGALATSFLIGCTNVPQGGAKSAADIYSVRAFGATGDGKTLDTAAVNKAIDAANAAGGGTVVFPPGTYLCFSIHLKSNVCLCLDQAATILAA